MDTQKIFCADDFGLHPAVNQAVLELAHLGRLNATTCLVDGSVFAHDAAALRQSPLQTGLHLNFTENLAEGLRQHPALPLTRLIRRSWLRRLNPEHVKREVARQLDRFEAVMQRAPDFIDGHQHVHQFPQIRAALVDELQQRYPDHPTLWLRSTRYYARARPGGSAVSPTPGEHPHRIKALIIECLGALALQSTVAGRWRISRALAGVYDFRGGEAAYTRLLKHWRAAMQPGDVLMCHPARTVMPHDPLGAQRVAEYRVLVTLATIAQS